VVNVAEDLVDTVTGWLAHDVPGLRESTHAAEDAVDYYAQKSVNGSWMWGIPGSAAALWIPENHDATVDVLAGAAAGSLASGASAAAKVATCPIEAETHARALSGIAEGEYFEIPLRGPIRDLGRLNSVYGGGDCRARTSHSTAPCPCAAEAGLTGPELGHMDCASWHSGVTSANPTGVVPSRVRGARNLAAER
jgi:hypothetical protein